MSNYGWGNPSVGDDVDDILNSLQGDSDYPIGFAGLTPTSIGATTTTDVSVPLSAWLRIERMVLGQASCVALCRVADVKVGTISLNVGTQAVPCEAFKHDAVGTKIAAAVWASPAVPPTVRLYNGTAGSIVFEGGLFGPVSRDQPRA